MTDMNDLSQFATIQAGVENTTPRLVPTTGNKAKLYAKIAAVTGTMRRIPKSGKHEKQGWMYPTWDDITEAINEALGANNLAILPQMAEPPVMVELGKNNYGTPSIRCTVIVDFTLADGESGETEVRRWYGWADDTSGGEKAIDKALTYCEKSFLKKLFVISAGRDEDPEGATSVYDQQGFNNQQQPQQPPLREVKPPRNKPAEQPKQEAPGKPAVTENGKHATERVKSKETFVEEAKEAGFGILEFKAVLPHFGFSLDEKGGLNYKPDIHDQMIADLKAWRTFSNAFQATLPKDEVLQSDSVLPQLKLLGLTVPLQAQAVIDAIPLVQKYRAFVDEALRIAPYEKAKEVFTTHKLLPWKIENTELMLQTLRSQVQAEVMKEEIREAAAIEEVTGGDVEDDDVESAIDDEIEDMLTGSAF